MATNFHKELVLNRWVLGFFIGSSIEALKQRLGDDRHEGIDEDGQTKFFHELLRNLFHFDRISQADLRRFDLNIVSYWQAITEHRNKLEGSVLNMKYFQYLSLLFTEIYLDWYFNRRDKLLAELNDAMAAYNGTQKPDERMQAFLSDELNKLAFWNATGSGKTLLLHINIKQYLHYFHIAKPGEHPDKIILLTPNEGLSRQHLEELSLSGFQMMRLFDKSGGSLFKDGIEVIDINKLGDTMGDKTVAAEAFAGNNLVLVDEGHRGTASSAGAWMARREVLTRGGFSFEYSATFGQAVAKGSNVLKAELDILKKKAKMLFDTASIKQLTEEQRKSLALTSDEKRKARLAATREAYAKCVLFDYSYKFFYQDGYGKESLILNLDDKAYKEADVANKYFTACLLSFYQQQYLWQKEQQAISDFNIEKPLWVFVGNTVNGEDADILNVLRFLASFINNDTQSKAWIKEFIENHAQLLDAKGRNIFDKRFVPLMNLSAEDVYTDILRKLFNVESKQRLKLVNMKKCKGELALKVGNGDAFGLINIGDDASFYKEAEAEKSFDCEVDEMADSMFGGINAKKSQLNVLIGSRKFTEGWSSWRVSTMGLLNMGSGEGSQIIQLFGRGVRLKGRNFSLKRTTPSERPKGSHLERLETLNIFGVNAGYMKAFKEYLKEEGVATSDDMLEVEFNTQSTLPEGKLKTLALKDGYKDNQLKGFKRTHYPWLYEVPAEFAGKIKLPHIELDMYPKLEALMAGKDNGAAIAVNVRDKVKINPKHMVLFDFERVYLAIQEYKLLRSWSNLRLDLDKLKQFCENNKDWYTLYMPAAELEINQFSTIKKLEDILIRLLQDYTDRFYKALKAGYEGQFYDIVRVSNADEGMLKLYQFEIEDSDEGVEYKKKIETLKKLVEQKQIGAISKWSANQMVAICFDRHVYYPLMHLGDPNVPLKMRPVLFDGDSEIQFVRDLQAFYESPKGKEAIGARSLYLMRNADTQSKGLGFALAGNFYPDFLLWLVDEESGKQWLTFVDPKGIRQMNLTDPKLQLYKEVKVLQEKLGDKDLELNAFIASITPYASLLNPNCTKTELEERNVLFMDDGGDKYLEKLFSMLN